MRDLDDTDLEILSLLTEDARRPYNEIADHVGLTPPAVSDRISRLEEQGVIQGFTVDIDRSTLRQETAVLVDLHPRPDAVAEVYDAATTLDGVDHVFEGMDGHVLVHAAISGGNVRSWLATELDLSRVLEYDVTPLTRSDRRLALSAAGFALDCVLCGKEITDGGVTTTVDGERKTFCCRSCEGQYVEEYEARRGALESE
ncbi:AsnC family transcriptional regulator [Natrialba hulunbeirensis JCM 10989]|uniref:AsnC family transcriptional regulator n=1 Tax=Natrialba hulunbeirensis JCM 10989 TaxID=1227493 RepID=M0A616_9EURY|nr:winged helix-turn-helix transcriptional regulator [Natrialba hulunbeirensis]ELY93342.1 AsnC family transcriptional regulator [Natrialba hulunbeirensis JCM 10989]